MNVTLTAEQEKVCREIARTGRWHYVPTQTETLFTKLSIMGVPVPTPPYPRRRRGTVATMGMMAGLDTILNPTTDNQFKYKCAEGNRSYEESVILSLRLELLTKIARAIAKSLSDNYDNAFRDKSEWVEKGGEKDGLYRHVYEPFQADYEDAAKETLAIFLEEIKDEMNIVESLITERKGKNTDGKLVGAMHALLAMAERTKGTRKITEDMFL